MQRKSQLSLHGESTDLRCISMPSRSVPIPFAVHDIIDSVLTLLPTLGTLLLTASGAVATTITAGESGFGSRDLILVFDGFEQSRQPATLRWP